MHSSAMIAFGFKQIKIEKDVGHPNTVVEARIEDQHLPTPWNELEVGMGLMQNFSKR